MSGQLISTLELLFFARKTSDFRQTSGKMFNIMLCMLKSLRLEFLEFKVCKIVSELS